MVAAHIAAYWTVPRREPAAPQPTQRLPGQGLEHLCEVPTLQEEGDGTLSLRRGRGTRPRRGVKAATKPPLARSLP